eukprot:gene3878-15177_t
MAQWHAPRRLDTVFTLTDMFRSLPRERSQQNWQHCPGLYDGPQGTCSIDQKVIKAKRSQQTDGCEVSFEAFMEAKGKGRAAGFKAKKTQKSKSQQPFEVNVQIGIMQKKDGLLRIARGSCLPSRLAQAWVLKSCWQKHLRKLSDSTKMYS